MTNYRRNFVHGGSFFFAVNLADRGTRLLTERVGLLRGAFRYTRSRHPFAIEAIVVLPDHIHAIWTLPEGDADFSLRWRLIKSVFSRGTPVGERISRSRATKGERGIWQRRYWEHTLHDADDFARHADYIHFNPVKHGYDIGERMAPFVVSAHGRGSVSILLIGRDASARTMTSGRGNGIVVRPMGFAALNPSYRIGRRSPTMAYYESHHRAGRHFLQIPGPTNVPERVLRAIDNPTMDHRGPDFGRMGKEILANIRLIFQTGGPVVIYPASGTGAWEAALANTLSPGDAVLMCRTGWFASLWKEMAERLALEPIFVETDWRRGADVEGIAAALAENRARRIKAVCVVHNETSTGCTSRIDEVRRAMDEARHPALLMVDTISSLASIDYRHDEWGVDVTVAGSQKGLMLPPGLSFNAIGEKALKAAEAARLPRSYWDWRPMLAANANGYFPYTPGTNLLYGLNEAIKMLLDEGLPNVFARHDRHAEATRRAVRAWGLEVNCLDRRHYSSSLTAVRVPEGHSADALRATILEKYNMSLGNGLGILKDKVFRIGHLGDFNDLQLIGTLGGVEMGLRAAGIPHRAGGVQAAIDYLSGNAGVGGL